MKGLVASYLLVQLGLPLWQLTKPRPARFGWQMYSAYHPVDVFVVDRAGSRHAVPAHQIDRVRADLDPLDAIAVSLCGSPAVARLVIVDPATGRERSRSCRGARP